MNTKVITATAVGVTIAILAAAFIENQTPVGKFIK